MKKHRNTYYDCPYPDPLVRHCPHHRCRRVGLCRVGGRNRRCLAIQPLRRSLVNRLMTRLAEQIG